MEDQPADSGDLTTGEPEKPRRRPWFGRRRPAAETPAEPEAAETETDASATESAADSAPERLVPVGKTRRKAASGATEAEAPVEVEDTTDAEETPELEEASEPAQDGESDPEPVLVEHRPAGKRLTYVAAAAAAVFVGAAAFAGAMVQPYLADRALVATKFQVAQTAADAITTLWTYNPDNIESLPDRASRFLASDFAKQYREFIDSIVPTNKQAQITNDTEVMGTAVETIGPDEATAIVYTNSVSTSPVTKNVPSLRYLSYRLTLQRDGAGWRITQMPALTQLDLSPQI